MSDVSADGNYVVSPRALDEDLDELEEKLSDGGFKVLNRFPLVGSLLVSSDSADELTAWLGDNYTITYNTVVSA